MAKSTNARLREQTHGGGQAGRVGTGTGFRLQGYARGVYEDFHTEAERLEGRKVQPRASWGDFFTPQDLRLALESVEESDGGLRIVLRVGGLAGPVNKTLAAAVERLRKDLDDGRLDFMEFLGLLGVALNLFSRF